MTYIPYQSESDTSKQAADEIKASAANLKQCVLEFITNCADHGATDEEIQRGLNMNPSTQRPRRIDLTNEGLVIDSGEKRLTSSKRNAVVWVNVKSLKNTCVKFNFMQKLQQLGFKSLEEYYESDHWKVFKKAYYSQHPKRCWATGRTDNIDLHHITYENLGNEKDEDVIPLCREMHEKLHKFVKEYKVPLDKAHLVLKETYTNDSDHAKLAKEDSLELIEHLKEKNFEQTRNDLLFFIVNTKRMTKELLEFFRNHDPDYTSTLYSDWIDPDVQDFNEADQQA